MTGLEIIEHHEPGFNTLVRFESWRVAMLNHSERHSGNYIRFLEKHLLTDEVFVLLQGNATLIIGEDLAQCKMEPNKIYNVKKGTYHTIRLSEDAKVLLVENDCTGHENSEYLKVDLHIDLI